MTIIITNPDGMTSEWFTSLLSDAGVLKGGRVESVELNAFGGGVMTNMVQAKLSYSGASDAPASVLVKYPSADEGNLGIARIMGLYELEVRFYRDIAPRLQKMSIPKCYTAQFDDGTGRFVLVIEDLSATTKPGTGLETLSEKECSAVLRELANFQAPLWNSPMLGEIDWLADNQRTLGFFDAIPAGLAPYLERFGNKLDPEHVKLFESVVPQSGQWARSWKAPNVLQHGEFRAANVLFGVAPTAPDVTVLDFQTVRVGPPGVDPAYFLGASLTTDDRRCMERRLIESYHRNLVDAGVQRFSWDDCWRSYCEGALYGVFMYVVLALMEN
ncbi:aminoglycoside phosphotransferase [Stutzerimonas stutzeri]|uniref:phosphotransferase n=1 Tax=Stutzerimonas stutzeri TaxID=316 RepID=UPI0024A4D013|nr:phosphotransferase [Stutzerimonas stutzeri]GLZ26655.1 aminoglycoside phosphotransferase [Stutzerimonas stutzeri]